MASNGRKPVLPTVHALTRDVMILIISFPWA